MKGPSYLKGVSTLRLQIAGVKELDYEPVDQSIALIREAEKSRESKGKARRGKGRLGECRGGEAKKGKWKGRKELREEDSLSRKQKQVSKICCPFCCNIPRNAY